MSLLHRGDGFPQLTLSVPGGENIRVPEAFAGQFGVLVDDEAFVNPDPVHLQSTGLVLGPAGKVVVSVYSSGAIGRLVPDDVAGLVRYVREHAAAPA
jgi:hypothetical protein